MKLWGINLSAKGLDQTNNLSITSGSESNVLERLRNQSHEECCILAWHERPQRGLAILSADGVDTTGLRPKWTSYPRLRGVVFLTASQYAGIAMEGMNGIDSERQAKQVEENSKGGVHVLSYAVPNLDLARGDVVESRLIGRFRAFEEAIRNRDPNKDIPWLLLEPPTWPEDLVAVYLALVAEEKGVNVLDQIDSKVWEHAGKDLHELGGTCGEIVSSAPTASDKKDDRLRCRRDIHAVFSKIAANQS